MTNTGIIVKKRGNMAEKNNKYRESIKSILLGIVFIFVAILLWYHIVGNPLDELALIQGAKVTTGNLVDTYESESEDYRGRMSFSEVGIYAFRLSDGREFKTQGYLTDEQVEIEYLPDNPSTNRVKGEGCQSITELLWRKVLLGVFLFALLITPGITVLRNGVRDIMKIRSTTPIRSVSGS